MPIVVRRKTDGAIYADFQTHAQPGTLIANAVRAGFAAADALEEVNLSDKDYADAETAAYASIRAAADAEYRARRAKVVTAAQGLVGKRADLFTAAEVRLFNLLLGYNAGAIDADLIVNPLPDWLND